MTGKLSYCGELVREHDRDRFLLSLFAPEEAREALWAVFAFNHEIAKTREVVSESQLGLIRLQWWREAVDAAYGNGAVPNHEIARALAAAVKAHNLPRAAFDMLLEAREFDLQNAPPENIDGFINYADFTSTPLLTLAAHVTGADPDYEPVRQVAVNYALTGLLRAVPFMARQGRSMLPADLAAKYKVNPGRLEPGENLNALARELSGQFVTGLKPTDRVLKAAQALARVYFRQLAGVRYNVLSPKLNKPPKFKEIRVMAGVLAA